MFFLFCVSRLALSMNFFCNVLISPVADILSKSFLCVARLFVVILASWQQFGRLLDDWRSGVESQICTNQCYAVFYPMNPVWLQHNNMRGCNYLEQNMFTLAQADTPKSFAYTSNIADNYRKCRKHNLTIRPFSFHYWTVLWYLRINYYVNQGTPLCSIYVKIEVHGT